MVLRDASLEVSVDVSKGGAITYLNILDGAEFSGDIVNHGDVTGREIQFAYYDSHRFDDSCWPCKAMCLWGPSNPVQEGNACQQRSGGALLASSETQIVTRTAPREWNSQRGVSTLELQQTLTLVSPGALRVDYQVTNRGLATIGADNWHEAPVAYVTPAFSQGTLSDGRTPTRSMIGFRDDHGWIALSRPDGWTVALYARGDHLSSIGLGGGGDKPTSYLQLWQWMELNAGETGTATAWLVVGRSIEIVRARLASVSRP